MEFSRKKRGLSPVVATVLLIALVLILILIIFLWARGFISEQIEKSGQSAEIVCGEVSFDVSHQEFDTKINLQIVNRGNIPINDFDIKIVSGGDSSQNTYGLAVDVGKSVSGDISKPVDLDELIIYPVILGKVSGGKTNKAYTCLNHGKVISL